MPIRFSQIPEPDAPTPFEKSALAEDPEAEKEPKKKGLSQSGTTK
jgi:hypothetical protein